MSNDKPKSVRTWTILNGDTCSPFVDGPDIAYAEVVHVIEHAEYEALKRKANKLFGSEGK